MVESRIGLGPRSGYHSPQLDVEVKLNTNESPQEPPEGFYERFNERLRSLRLNRYPDRGYHQVREAIAERDGVDPSEVFAANGSNEVLQTICLSFGGPERSVLVVEPTYSMHTQIARSTGAIVETRFRADPHSLGLDEFVSMLDQVQPDIAFLCSPNNPTGELLDASLVEAAVSKSDRLVVFDEAYVDFAGVQWQRSAHSNVIQSKTFSKAFALAGARFGYCVGTVENVAVLDAVVLPYHLDSVKQALVLTSMEFLDEASAGVAAIVDRRTVLAESLSDLGLGVFRSDSNFLLVDFGSNDATLIWDHLVKDSILVRNCTSWPGVGNCLRITVGTESEHSRLLESLSKALHG